MLKIKAIGRKGSYGLVLVLLTSLLSACNTASNSSTDRTSNTVSTSNQSDGYYANMSAGYKTSFSEDHSCCCSGRRRFAAAVASRSLAYR